jgi:hypothetical protein
MSYARDVDAQTLLAGSVVTAQRWLENAEANPSSVPSDFNWHGFAEGAATNAHVASTMHDADPWASISVRVYDRLASEREHDASFELSGMNLRAWMIRRYGASADNPVRDLRKLVEWFRTSVPMPLADAEQEATQLRARPVEEWPQHLDVLRTLRALKNRINVFRGLDDPPAELEPWLKLWALLP